MCDIFLGGKASNGHKIFVSTEAERRNFDPAKYFNTSKDLVHHTSNRLTLKQLSEMNRLTQNNMQSIKNLKKQSMLNYWKAQLRIKKVDTLKKNLRALNLKRYRQNPKEQFLVYKKRDVNSGKVVRKNYKWIKERKR
ncbi:hypothetical protein RFI_03314 [Reticulomyxa filosa]|uniref:Uncharacterized protein n=1 Tax=Reticulomyxa filosa TaxID=46433 RepID=X6P6S2_RETFI|nr:hypothetical protein RFI_03314 [Reticulomyxa filosa]|eukprot:ETO33789.1 hypothetical protein RFI_03314 [Reticulomyxa filosa]